MQLVTSRQGQYLGTVSVLKDHARGGEVLRGFYALMALWQSLKDLSGDNQLEVCTYRVKLKTLAWSKPTECGLHQLGCGEIVRTPGELVCVFS